MSAQIQPSLSEPKSPSGGQAQPMDLGTWREYIALIKPGILRLILILTFCSMLVAERGLPSLSLVLWTLLGMTMMSGSANALNMIYDRDIDAVMLRTMERPLPAGRIGVIPALVYALVLGVVAFGQLWFTVNLLTAVVALGGHLFYVLIYTMWLKRSTPQNIVIGGAAGSVPPLVGWAAVTGELSIAAWVMFAIIFMWTPPHFWALSLYKRDDYARANIPMLPVVKGLPATRLQIVWYTILLIPVTLLLGYTSPMGLIYMTSATILGAIFLFMTVKILQTRGAKWPRRTFFYSILYLGLLFAAMSVDSVIDNPASTPPSTPGGFEIVPADGQTQGGKIPVKTAPSNP